MTYSLTWVFGQVSHLRWEKPGQLMPTTRKPWSREELLILLSLYEKIPFGKFDQGNPVLVDVARRMERTPGSVAMKLSNLASLDARLAARGIKGLSGASALDRAVWEEFHTHRNTLVPESQALLNALMAGTRDAEVVVVPEAGVRVRKVPSGASTTTREAAVRLGQDYFRDVVLNHYGRRCAVTGLGIEPLLIASHIVPWSVREDSRYDERNGIALNALHDKAFDPGSSPGRPHHLRYRATAGVRPFAARPLCRNDGGAAIQDLRRQAAGHSHRGRRPEAGIPSVAPGGGVREVR